MRGKRQNQTENPPFGDKELLSFTVWRRNSDKRPGRPPVVFAAPGFQEGPQKTAIAARGLGGRAGFWRDWTDCPGFSAKVGQNRAFFVMKYSRKTEMPS